MEGETVRADTPSMQAPDFHVVVVRAWRESGGLRVRLIVDGDAGRHWVVGSIGGAQDVLGALLAELVGGPTLPADPPNGEEDRDVR
jgi:hypothetical protein